MSTQIRETKFSMPAYDQIDNHACTLKSSLGETSKRTVTSGETCKRENSIPWNDKRNTMTFSQSQLEER